MNFSLILFMEQNMFSGHGECQENHIKANAPLEKIEIFRAKPSVLSHWKQKD